jgi:hypothetical protein
MNPAADDLGAVIAAALREHDRAAPVDLPDGRRRLAAVLPVARRQRRRKAIAWAVTAAAAVFGLIAVLALPYRHIAAPPAAPDGVLSSGLPVGLLVGEVSHTHEETHRNIVEVSLLVRRDGSGWMRGPSIVGESTPVRYVSTGPGAVTIYDDNPICAGRPDLTLQFTVSHRVVTITRAVASACSTTPEAAAELTGAMLHPAKG